MAIHGIPAPFAMAGYLMGEHALKVLQLERFDADIEVIHYSPVAAPWISIVDGLQAGTGASLAASNLRTAVSRQTYSIVRNRKTGKALRMSLVPEFVGRYASIAKDKLFSAGLEVSELKPESVFVVEVAGRAANYFPTAMEENS